MIEIRKLKDKWLGLVNKFNLNGRFGLGNT